jgi:aryl sulfotransferase
MGELAQLVRPATRHVRNRIFDSAGWDDFPIRDDDIVIATYAKCGTTWTQRIVGMMVYGSAAPFAVQDSSPWPDFRMPPPGVMRELAESQSHRRYLKSHLPYDAIPVHEGVKFVHVARDGRDAAMSFYNHKINYTDETIARFFEICHADPKYGPDDDYHPVPSDPAQHFSDWLDGPEDDLGDPGASYWVMERSFWAARHDPNVLLVHYNDLKADRDGEMRRIAEFLGIEIAPDVWPELVEAAGFSAMKAAATDLMPTAGNIWKGGGKTFINQGTNGRWQDVVRPKDLERYSHRVAQEFTPGLAAWCEHGRLVTGDPRELAD